MASLSEDAAMPPLKGWAGDKIVIFKIQALYLVNAL